MSELYADASPATSPPEEDLLTRLIRQAEAQGTSASADLPPEGSGNINGETSVNSQPTASGQPAIGGLLNGLLSNPALLSALPQLLNGLGALSKGSVAQPADARPTSAPSVAASSTATGGGAPLTTVKIPHLDRHTALLCAIKPYLGSSRQQAAEYLINLCRVWNTLQGMGLNLPALLLPPQGRADDPSEKEV